MKGNPKLKNPYQRFDSYKKNPDDQKRIPTKRKAFYEMNEILGKKEYLEYDLGSVEWNQENKNQDEQSKEAVKDIQAMINFINKYSDQFKNKLPELAFSSSVDGYLTDGKGKSNTRDSIIKLNRFFGITGSHLMMGVVSAELMAKLRSEVAVILDKNENSLGEPLIEASEIKKSIFYRNYLRKILFDKNDGIYFDKSIPELWNELKDIKREDFEKDYGFFPDRFSGAERKFQNVFGENSELKSKKIFEWLKTKDGKNFLKGKHEQTGRTWETLGEYVKHLRILREMHASNIDGSTVRNAA